MAASMTTISVNRKTKAVLDEIGNRGESYDELIRRILGELAWKRLNDRWDEIMERDELIPFEDL